MHSYYPSYQRNRWKDFFQRVQEFFPVCNSGGAYLFGSLFAPVGYITKRKEIFTYNAPWRTNFYEKQKLYICNDLQTHTLYEKKMKILLLHEFESIKGDVYMKDVNVLTLIKFILKNLIKFH